MSVWVDECMGFIFLLIYSFHSSTLLLFYPFTHQLLYFSTLLLFHDANKPENPINVRASKPAVIKVRDAPLNTRGTSA